MGESKQPAALDKALIVLEAVAEHSRFTDIVSATGLAKSSVHRILKTLVEYEVVASPASGIYTPGPRLLSYAARAFKKIDISVVAEPVLDSLQAELGEQVHLGALNGKDAIYIAVRLADKPYDMPSRVGGSIDLYSTSIGKALLAYQSESALTAYFAQIRLRPFTPNTIADEAQLRRELGRIRACGWAIDDEENVPGIRCLAAPVRNNLGAVTHAISVSTLALEHSRDSLESFAPAVIEHADRLSALLGYEGAGGDVDALRVTRVR